MGNTLVSPLKFITPTDTSVPSKNDSIIISSSSLKANCIAASKSSSFLTSILHFLIISHINLKIFRCDDLSETINEEVQATVQHSTEMGHV